MSNEILSELHLSVMNNLLPAGLAVVDRFRKNGIEGVIDILKVSNDPLQDLKSEGEPSAQKVRDQLDSFKPGFGNPVVAVDVQINENDFNYTDIGDLQELMVVLNNIEERLSILDRYITQKPVSDDI
tara:strand:- start:412 stop:792 length:381 start_codon:yes stop_codon:yes gene_type:complete